jgi:hypothetical protein
MPGGNHVDQERFAERLIVGRDDRGEEERILVWLAFRPGALWVVGRAVNPHLRETDAPRPEDVVYESYELDDALEHVNEMLEDEVTVAEGDHQEVPVKPITRREIEPHLERRVFRGS